MMKKLLVTICLMVLVTGCYDPWSRIPQEKQGKQGKSSVEEYNRQGKSEYFLTTQIISSKEISVYPEISINIDNSTLIGGGVGYNLTDYLNLNVDILFGSTDVTYNSWGGSYTADTNLFIINPKLDYNILKSRFTPVISGGIGFFSYDSYLIDGSDFFPNLGIGFRWDITDNFIFKVMYYSMWTDLDTNSNIRFDTANLSVGYVF